MPRQVIDLEITRKIRVEIETEHPLNEVEIQELGSGLCHTCGEDATDMLEEMDRAGDVTNLECETAQVKIISYVNVHPRR